MKKILTSSIIATLTLAFTSCTLFIDDDKLLLEENTLPKYSGNGYDAPVTGHTEYVDVTYQLRESTMMISPGDELANYIHRVDTAGYITYIHFDKNMPKSMIPQEGQMMVSGSKVLFPHHGLCDKVYSVEERENEIIVRSFLSSPTDAFKSLKLKAHLPLDEIFEGMVMCNNEDSINNENVQANSPSLNAYGGNKVPSRFDDKEYTLNFSNVSEGIKNTFKGFGLENTYFEGKPFKFEPTIGGGIIWPKIDFDAGFGDDDDFVLNVDIEPITVDFSLGVQLVAGMTDDYYKRLSDLPKVGEFLKKIEDKLNSPKEIMIGIIPVVLVPNIFIEIGGSATAELDVDWWESMETYTNIQMDVLNLNGKKIKPTFDCGIDISGKGTVKFPSIIFNLGLGLYTDAVTFNLRPVFNVTSQLSGTLASTENLINDESNDNVFFSSDFNIGIGFKICADGGTLAKICKKISKKLKKISQAYDRAKSLQEAYVKSGTLGDWEDFFRLGMDKENDPNKTAFLGEDRAAEMYNLYEKTKSENAGMTDEQIKDKIMKDKAAEKEKIDKKANAPRDKYSKKDDAKKNGVKDEDVENTKNKGKGYEYEFGPYETDWLKWNITSRYMYPHMKTTTFNIGAKYKNGSLVVTPSFDLEDHGFDLEIWNHYCRPGFIIKYGSEKVWESLIDESTRITKDTPKGKNITTEIFLPESDKSYTCIPYYRMYNYDIHIKDYVDMDRVIYERGKTFSVITPSMSIVDLQVTKVEHNIEGDNQTSGPGHDVFYCSFDILISVSGLSLIADWGIRDDNKNEIHTKDEAKKENISTLEGGGKADTNVYRLSLSLKTETIKPIVSITPFCWVTGLTMQKQDNANYFGQWEQAIDLTKWLGDINTTGSNEYTLTLESVELVPDDAEDDDNESTGE